MDEPGSSTAGGGSEAPLIPGYAVHARLGEGASSSVWRATREADGLEVALKVVRPGEGKVEAGLREAGLLAGVRHQHLVRLYDVVPVPQEGTGRPQGLALAMQLAAGGSLARLLAHRRMLSPGEAVTVLQPVCGALADLHDRGLVHGDLSLGNVLFLADGMPLVADLGASRIVGERSEEVWATGAQEGMVAPEVLEGFAPTRESDVYAVGALAWRALVGDPPGPAFTRPPLGEVSPDLPEQLVGLVEGMLAAQPEDRPDAEEVATALLAVAVPEPIEVPSVLTEVDDGLGLTQRLRQQGRADLEAAGEPDRRRSLWRPRRKRARGGAEVRPSHRPGDGRAGRGGRGARDSRAGRGGRRGRGEGEGRVTGELPRVGIPVIVGVVLAAAVVVALLALVVPSLLLRAPATEPVAPADGPDAVVASGGAVAVPAGAPEGSASEDPVSEDAVSEDAALVAPGSDAHVPGAPVPGAPAGDQSAPATVAPPSSDPELARTLQELVDVRGLAWERIDAQLLSTAMAPGSPALAAEEEHLEALGDSGVTYADVTFRVDEARVVGVDGDHLRVAAVVSRAPLTALMQDGRRVQQDRGRTDEVEVVLAPGQEPKHGWVLWAWG